MQPGNHTMFQEVWDNVMNLKEQREGSGSNPHGAQWLLKQLRPVHESLLATEEKLSVEGMISPPRSPFNPFAPRHLSPSLTQTAGRTSHTAWAPSFASKGTLGARPFLLPHELLAPSSIQLPRPAPLSLKQTRPLPMPPQSHMQRTPSPPPSLPPPPPQARSRRTYVRPPGGPRVQRKHSQTPAYSA
ncbi:hypothetical protein BC834DRAFT_545142 [Gloeopeniophorella convolvens]|nr:hypothetical protein BC834DRAFT_545142 [Gloeopeniophorella convolvens]